MKNTKSVFLAVILSFLAATAIQAQVVVKDVAIDRLLDGVRVSVACSGTPNISSFITHDPPAIVIDIMDATSRLTREKLVSSYYPVTAVTVKPSEAINGVRVTVNLKRLVRHSITNENGVIAVQVGTQPLPPPPAPIPEDQFSGKPPLTLLVQDAEVTSVLRMLARQFDLNMMVTQDVKSVVSVRLNEVPLRAGLEALVKAAGCNIVEDRSGVLIVKPFKKEMYGELQTRVFNLDYVEAEDVIKVIKKVLSPLGEAVSAFRRVGTKGGGVERSGILVVSDVPEALDEVAKVIAELDRPMPQIAIEAKFIETTHSTQDRFGIDWTPIASFTTDLPKIGEEVALPVIIGGEMLVGKISFAQFTAAVEFMRSQGRSRVLANPRTVTVDNQTASISMGLDVPIREINKDPNTGEITYTWRTRSIPIKMEVTPHVTSDGMITMNVKPSVSAITGWIGSADDRQPIVAKREAETQVKVADGEVVVIGGLVKDEETRNVGKIPLLGDIPILGHLFKKTTIERTKSDLMIFIIPRIIYPEG